MTLGDTTYRFVRLIEGGARAFALVPSDASTRLTYSRALATGRAKRLGDLRFYDEVVRYFDNEGVSRTYETQEEALAARPSPPASAACSRRRRPSAARAR